MDHKSESVNCDQFMTSEGTDTLNLAFTTKTNQYVAPKNTEYFYLGFYVIERIHLGNL